MTTRYPQSTPARLNAEWPRFAHSRRARDRARQWTTREPALASFDSPAAIVDWFRQ